MKKIYKKEEGVSPVIATILMVAITVVLAATVWLMVSGYLSPSKPALQGSLQYNYQASDLSNYNATFTLLLSQPPEGIAPDDIHLHVNGTTATYYKTQKTDLYWGFVDNDGDEKVSNGDLIWITNETDASETVTHGTTISFGATGYSGSITAKVP